MPKKWEAEDELKLLLGVIHVISAQVPGNAWPDIATYMGEGYTSESVRQKFQNIKRATAGPATNGDNAASATSTPAKGTKAKAPATKGSAAKATNGTGKGRKRKAASLSPTGDNGDDEEAIFQPKAKAAKIKNEEVVKDEIDAAGAEVFEGEGEEEEEGGERDEVYA